MGASAADIITYVGVPLAILGVAPILYTYIKTMIMSIRLKRTLKTYDIEASVRSRLLSGVLDVNVPTYQLTLPPRETEQYWNLKTTNGSRHGASWQNINWLRRPIDEKMLQVHFSDGIKLPEASVNFADLARYLGDLGLQTNPEGFWDLAQKGLNVLPGTCVVKEVGENGVEKPILVVAKPTIEHPGTLLLRFQNQPSKSLRKKGDISPDWIPMPKSEIAEPTKSIESKGPEAIEGLPEAKEVIDSEKATAETEEREKMRLETIEHVRINRKGIHEKKLTTGATLPVLGLSFWFTYALLASTASSGHRSYDGRPFGFQIRLDVLYFSREAVLALDEQLLIGSFLSSLLNQAKMDDIPAIWTEDSPARVDLHLTKRFELLANAKLRNRSAQLRLHRKESLMTIRDKPSRSRLIMKSTIVLNPKLIYVPFEALVIPTATWTAAVSRAPARRYIPMLPLHRVPTSQEICVAAISNEEFARMVVKIITYFQKWFVDGLDERPLGLPENKTNPLEKVAFMCAVIILQSIAEGAPYLASLIDVEECVSKWDPVYCC